MDALRPIADWICSLEPGHPTRVGLDGPSAAGKSTLADLLAETVQSVNKRPVIRASIDDFHRPGHKFRSMRGEWTTQLYYDESYDYLAFRDLVLRPLGPGGNRRVRRAIFDSSRRTRARALADGIGKHGSDCRWRVPSARGITE